MKIQFTKKINKILRHLGFELFRYYPEMKQKTFDEIYKEILGEENLVIFDVGANQGQSIFRFDKLFNSKEIYSFEPIEFEYLKMRDKYQNNKFIKINNYALGEKIEKKSFFINEYTGSSSFYDTRKDTEWCKLRSKQFNINPKHFTKEKKMVDIDTIDNFCQSNEIGKIDILKIDTQGYEDKVLLGASNMINNKRIKFIEFEIIFSDIYSKTLSIGLIENIIGKNFRLFANDNKGNLYSNFIYQLNLIYIEKNFFEKAKNKNEL